MRTIHAVLGILVTGCAGNVDVDSSTQQLCTAGDPCCPTPIIIDIAGDGITLTAWEDGVAFAFTPGLGTRQWAWTQSGSDDAWLVMDRNGNGRVDGGYEMFGNYSPQLAPVPGKVKNGFAALALLDSNNDGVVDANDPQFFSLRLWQDRNHDGGSQPEELRTLTEVGVVAISTEYRSDGYVDAHGNQFLFSGIVTAAHGSRVARRAWDVLLAGGKMQNYPIHRGISEIQQELDTWWCSCEVDVSPENGNTCPSRIDARGSGSTEGGACTRCLQIAQGEVPAGCYSTSGHCYDCYAEC